ncbi:MAG TPA: App1 family protein [Flavobacteriaceae bacterium]|nr:App1 family protein [Flavobacteriaceae bacterium]
MKLNLKIYRGYANNENIVVTGHVFKKNTPDKYGLNKSKFKHAWSVIRMFSIKTIRNADVELNFAGKNYRTRTLDDGYFQFTIPYSQELESGWHQVSVSVNREEKVKVKEGEFIKPHPGEYGIISDIDDTFLISHSGNIFRKLYFLLTKNIDKRKVFDEVVSHYRLLDRAGRRDLEKSNAFYYVSSSEWNLYNFIENFMKLHELPKGVLKLKAIKTGVFDFLTAGRGNHNHKFFKIKHIMEFHPELKFILLGDDTQQDPHIYEQICKIFSENTLAVYIRQTRHRPDRRTVILMENMASMGVSTCYFRKSGEAIAHSKSIGIIN